MILLHKFCEFIRVIFEVILSNKEESYFSMQPTT